jgi:hypothetical protein
LLIETSFCIATLLCILVLLILAICGSVTTSFPTLLVNSCYGMSTLGTGTDTSSPTDDAVGFSFSQVPDLGVVERKRGEESG